MEGLGGANEDLGAGVVLVDAALPLGAADLGAAEALDVEIVLADSGAGLGADSGAGLGAGVGAVAASGVGAALRV